MAGVHASHRAERPRRRAAKPRRGITRLWPRRRRHSDPTFVAETMAASTRGDEPAAVPVAPEPLNEARILALLQSYAMEPSAGSTRGLHAA